MSDWIPGPRGEDGVQGPLGVQGPPGVVIPVSPEHQAELVRLLMENYVFRKPWYVRWWRRITSR